MENSYLVNEENFINQLSKILEIERKSIDLDSCLSEYMTWDSLAIISSIAYIDQHFGVTIQGKEIEACKSINVLLQLIKSKL